MNRDDAQELLADLDALDALFASPRNWTQFTLGRMCDGTATRDVDAACSWCLSGAVAKVTRHNVEGGMSGRRWSVLLDELAISYGEPRLPAPTWNDDDKRTFADVKKLIAATRARIQSSAGRSE